MIPPHSNGEVPVPRSSEGSVADPSLPLRASADGGVISPTDSVAYDPSARDYAGTSPSEWGGKL
jgi:hypothetical protein